MKCPKCGYLGFETTDRCRNCQYDFSLAPVRSDPDLALQTEHRVEGSADFDLPPLNKPTDSLSDSALDLDRLFGELVGEKAAATNEFRTSDGDSPMTTLIEDAAPMVIEEPPPAVIQAADEPEGALPFDDSPIVPPPAAKPPLAVRRSTPELPRHRRRIPRPERLESLSFEPEPQGNAVSESVADTMALLMEAPALGVRIGAGLIDLIFLIAIDIVVLYLTLRISGLQTTLEDLRVLPPIPFAGFLAMLAFGYVAAFTVAGGQTIGQRRAKFRQVNRFVELVDDVVPRLPEGPLRIVDFGSGRAYLTFALHDLLVRRHGRRVELLGLDVKQDVVAECEALARRLDAEGLRFEVGDIADADLDDVDLVVSLHACDTATDAALDRAVRGGARVILAVPCCQHELLGQLDNEVLRPLLRHGTLRERFVAEVTDAARARLLELAGYEVQVVEFVALEHTPKNVLLRAVRTERPERDRARLAVEYRAFADSLGIRPALERLLGDLVPA